MQYDKDRCTNRGEKYDRDDELKRAEQDLAKANSDKMILSAEIAQSERAIKAAEEMVRTLLWGDKQA